MHKENPFGKHKERRLKNIHERNQDGEQRRQSEKSKMIVSVKAIHF